MEVCLENPLKIPLVLSDVVLLWKFVPVDYDKETDNNQEKQPTIITNETDISKVLGPEGNIVLSNMSKFVWYFNGLFFNISHHSFVYCQNPLAQSIVKSKVIPEVTLQGSETKQVGSMNKLLI